MDCLWNVTGSLSCTVPLNKISRRVQPPSNPQPTYITRKRGCDKKLATWGVQEVIEWGSDGDRISFLHNRRMSRLDTDCSDLVTQNPHPRHTRVGGHTTHNTQHHGVMARQSPTCLRCLCSLFLISLTLEFRKPETGSEP